MQPLTSPFAGPIPGVPSQQPTNLFRFGEITLYSTQLFSGAGLALTNSVSRLFATPLGAQGQGYATSLTKSETNLKEGGRIPSGQAYDVYGVATQILGAEDTEGAISQCAPFDTASRVEDLQGIINNGILSWDFTQTVVDICPVMLSGAGGGAFGAGNAAAGALNNGNGGIWMYRKHPVALPGNTTFAVLLQFGSRACTLTAPAAIRVVLLGYYKSVIEIGN
jgi:hypothetical protein